MFIESIVQIFDNSGIRFSKIIHIYGTSSRKTVAKISNNILVSTKTYEVSKNDKLQQLNLAVLIKQKKNTKRKNGHYIKFSKNGALLLKEPNETAFTRIRGPVASELR
jgi:ribosomal protein L14